MQNVDEIFNKIGIGRFNVFLIFVMGFVQVCNSIDVWILAILNSVLQCEWEISSTEMSFLSSSVLVGMIVGSPLLGKFSDKYGRKTLLILGCIGLVYFSIINSFTTTLYWIIIIRFCMGLFHGINSSVNFTMLSEMNPMKYRGTFIVLLQLFWAAGSLFITALSYFVIPKLGWRVFLILSCIPIVIVLLALIWIPESPRFLLSLNRKKEFIEALNYIARWNRSESIIDVKSSPAIKSTIRDLFHPNYLWTTVFISFIFFVAGLNYYGIVILMTVINEIPHVCLQDWTMFSHIQIKVDNKMKDDSCCSELNWQTHRNSFISSLGEIVFVPVSITLINVIGRKKTIASYFILTCVGIILLNLCIDPLYISVLFLFLRGAMKSIINVCHLYSSEVFPLSIRGLGIGFAFSFSKLGGVLAPFIIYVFIEKYSFLAGATIIFVLNLLAVILSFLLPYETKGRTLYESVDHGTNESDQILLNKTDNYQSIN